jgi:hypothetical protein
MGVTNYLNLKNWHGAAKAFSLFVILNWINFRVLKKPVDQ